MWNIAPAATVDGDRAFPHTPFDDFALPDEITRGPLITLLSHRGKRPQVEYPGPATTGRAWHRKCEASILRFAETLYYDG